MLSNRKLLNFIVMAMSFIFVTLLGFSLPGMSLAVTCDATNTKTADVVAIDHAVFFNRQGAFNPGGMIYALRGDVVTDSIPPSPVGSVAQAAAQLTGGSSFGLRPGKRPRPLVLRVNAGECLQISFQNLLKPVPHLVDPADPAAVPTFGEQPTTRSAGIYASAMQLVNSIADNGTYVGANSSSGLAYPGEAKTYTLYAEPGTEGAYLFTSAPIVGGEGDNASIAMGLFGSINVEPAGAEYYRSQLTRQELEWSLDKSNASQKDADFDGRYDSTGHPIIDYDATYPSAGTIDGGMDGDPLTDDPHPFAGLPIINMMQGNKIVHSYLRAIITGPGRGNHLPGTYPPSPALAPNNTEVQAALQGTATPETARAPGAKLERPREEPFREFTIIFHDEVFSHQAYPQFLDPTLVHTLYSTRDGFGINYGIGGIGSEILSNRFGVGPQWDCVECKYEEFFLTSWVLGDPALSVDMPASASLALGGPQAGCDAATSTCAADSKPEIATRAFFPDDPSNVEHSYIGDHVKMRNIHAGPKEHHIFHLHSHQWVFSPDEDQSAYLDSQSIGPGSSYNYEIAYNGSGNRNQTPGDAIFHCHFYPHFAQGMWALWRNHDVFEEGTDMNLDPGTGMPFDAAGIPTTPKAGARALPDGEIVAGTPIPALVPIPTLAMAPMPYPVQLKPIVRTQFADNREIGSNIDTTLWDSLNPPDVDNAPLGWSTGGTMGTEDIDHNSDGVFDLGTSDPSLNPGYPFFIAALAGHRPPNPVLDHAVIAGVIQDGGLHEPGVPNNSRHVVKNATVGEMHTNRLDMRKVTAEMEPEWYPEDGTNVEKAAIAFHSERTHASVTPEGVPLNYVTNGHGPVHGAPYADPCIDDFGNAVGHWPIGTTPSGKTPGANILTPGTDNTDPARLYKAADIQLDMVFNKLGEHFPQARMIALWQDVPFFMSGAKAPEPLFFRANSRECIEYWQTNLVPGEYKLDDFQVRTPTDVIGQHIHLVKFDVTSADGSANGWNYEDGAFSPEDVQERIHAINAFMGVPALAPVQHPEFPGPEGLGAVTVIQRWYADETMSMTGIDRTLRTVYTHDHYGPSTHQQTGLYAGLLIEPEDSEWVDMVTGVKMGSRADGGPTSWRANIHTNLNKFGVPDPTQSQSYREFMFEFADMALGYQPGPLGEDINVDTGDDRAAYAYTIPAAENFVNRSLSINPPAKAGVGLPFVMSKSSHCPGVNPASPPSRTCPEGISADDPGSFVVNYRNEPVFHRIHNPQPLVAADCKDPADFNKTAIGVDGISRTSYGCQAAGLAGDLSHVFRSDILRANPNMNMGPSDIGYPYRRQVGSVWQDGLTGGKRPGDPFTPLIQAFEDDRVQLRFMVGAHEEGHVESIYGVKWLFEPDVKASGWRNAQMAGISEHFEMELENLSPVKGDAPFADYLYTFDTSVDGFGAGVWGLMRTYQGLASLTPVDGVLQPLPNNLDGESPAKGQIANRKDFKGVCPKRPKRKDKDDADYSGDNRWRGERKYDITAVRAMDVLPGGSLMYNSRVGAFPNHPGPLHDPHALLYVFTSDIDKNTGKLKAGVPVEPLVLRAAAGECIHVTLRNNLPAGNLNKGDGYDIAPMLIENFNLNEVQSSNDVGLHPQLVAYDVMRGDGVNIGFNVSNQGLQTVAPGEKEKYKWYAGDHRMVPNPGGVKQFKLVATPIEFGATNLISSDPVNHSAQGLIASLIIEPEGAEWITDQERCYPIANDGKGKGKNKKSHAVAAPECFNGGTEKVYPNSRASATVTYPLLDANGNPILLPVLDANGQPVMEEVVDKDDFRIEDLEEELDAYGNITYDLDGNPVMVPVFDADGNPLYVLTPVLKPGSNSFREMVLQFQDNVQLRDSSKDPLTAVALNKPICPLAGAAVEEVPGAVEPPFNQYEVFTCGGSEDPEDAGNKAVNYRTEPAWFRMGFDPGAPLNHARNLDSSDLLSNSITKDANNPAGYDPETPILVTKAGEEVRFRILESGGHPRNHVFTIDGHIWQKSPYVTTTEDAPGTWGYDESSIGSEKIGDNPKSETYGAQAGHGPQNHFDVVLKSAGGVNGVPGDYLWRNQASFQFDGGHWGLLRVLP